MVFNPNRGPQIQLPPAEQLQSIVDTESSQSMSTQPEDVLRRATALLDGAAVTTDVAAFTQRILNSVEGKSTQEISSLAEQYARSTHPAEGAPVPSAEMLQELALTAAILEGHVAEMQNEEAATVQMQATPTEPISTPLAPAPEQAATTPEPATEVPAAVAEEPATTQIEQPSDEEIQGMRDQRAEILKSLGLTDAATLDDARTVAAAQRAHGTADKKEKVEAAMAELISIEARLGNADAHIADAALPDAPATNESADQTPEEAATELVTPTTQEPTTEAPVDNRGKPEEEPVDEAEADTEILTEKIEARTELGEDAYEDSIAIEHAREAIAADIAAFEKTLKRYEDREKDLDEQVGKLERYLPKFMLGKDRLKLVDSLNAVQIAVAHTREAIEGLKTSLQELENANDMMDIVLDDIMEEVAEKIDQ